MDFLSEEFEQILNIFRDESEEILDRINSNLVKLEKEPENKEYVFQLFRDAHSLKGASRMVGFVNIQTIAHKIEDILGLCKENKLELTKSICDVLLKSVDFLWLLVKNSIQLKADYSTNDMSYYQSSLQNIIDNASLTPIALTPKKVFNTTFYNEIQNINATFLEIIFLLSNQIDSEEKIQVVKELFDKLLEIFSVTDYFDIKQELKDIVSKLNFVLNATGILVDEEILEIKNKTKNIVDEYKKILENYDVEVDIDFFNYKKNSQEEIEFDEKKIITSNVEKCMSILTTEFDKLESFKANINEITTNLNIISFEVSDVNVKDVCSQLVDLFVMYQNNQISFDAEIINILKQTIKSLNGILCNSSDFQYDDINLLKQRLTILFQILDLESLKNTIVSVDGNLNQQNLVESIKVLPEFQKNNNAPLSDIETSAIKTLRVDSQKLDNLANSISELVINKVKYTSQLNELMNVEAQLGNTRHFVIKAINYLKYFENKLNDYNSSIDFNSILGDINAFQKHLLYLFQEINKKNFAIQENVNNLHDFILEDNSKNTQILEQVEKIIRDVRILPLATIFHIFPRMVRDLSYENGKDIELEIIGNDVSVDKKIVEEIKMPLIHIIRNSIDHGIETPEERIKAGKSSTGKISIKAFREYNKIIIEVIDDGRGINIQKIKEKAEEKGLLTPDELSVMTNEQIMNLVFYPGFSTENIVTELSGRGIGLDVVQTKIAQLNGKVKISSVFSKGSVLRLELPITTATINTFIFKLNNNYFAIPVDVISSLHMVKKSNIINKGNKEFVIIDNETIPVYWISDILGVPISNDDIERWTLMVINHENAKIGYLINSFEGDEEVILRKFAPPIFKVTNLAGITTLINGSSCLILNMQDVIKNTISQRHVFEHIGSRVDAFDANIKHSILVVDDSATTRTLLKQVLEKANFEVELAHLPSLGLEIVNQKEYDLIISDIEMPEMNGCEFIRKLKESMYNSKTPVVVFSSFENLNLHKELSELGIEHYFLKSQFHEKEFIDIIRNILRERYEK
ncbi:hybrid sensor histidine kinase/response regulator [bacterium]|nr:hybrid sensor histidine kinase/response regulator [bacterium]